jgi:hypothetical protein
LAIETAKASIAKPTAIKSTVIISIKATEVCSIVTHGFKFALS